MSFVDARIQEWTRLLKPLAIRRHFTRWPETRKSVSFNPCGKEMPDPCGSPTALVDEFFDYETNWFRTWIDRRIKWLDQNLPGTCGS